MTLHTGVHLPNYGDAATSPGVAAMAELAERAGLDSVWLSDHVLLVEGARSRYPFSPDGSFFLPPESDWLEWTVTAGYLAAIAPRVEIGVGVAVLPLRHPLLLAKQVATLDRLSGGRMLLGVGAGWLTEEIEALGEDPSGRGARIDGALELLRAAWSGRPAAGRYGPYDVPDGVHCQPVPVRDPLPVYVGGVSRAAVRRVARYGDGWYGTGPGGIPEVADIGRIRDEIDQECAAIDRDPTEVEMALRLSVPARQLGTAELEQRIGEYVAGGVGRLSFDLGWKPDTELMLERLRALVSASAAVQP